MNEEWKSIKDFDGYMISNFGRVKSIDRLIEKTDRLSGNKFYSNFKGKIIKPHQNKNANHQAVTLRKEGKSYRYYVHRLVIIAFRGDPENGLICCHNDGNPKNNHIDNLRWDSYKANLDDSIKHGTRKILRGEQIKHSKLTESELIELRKIKYYKGMYADLAKKYNMTLAGIRNAIVGISWKHTKTSI